MLYGRDLIAERDKFNQLHSTVVKWWNDKSLIAKVKKQQEEYEAAQAALMAPPAPEVEESDYNATTGSYSGAYGKNANLNEDETNQVASILGERRDSLQDLINQNKI